MAKIAVFGMGYVGIPAAALLADVDGFDVTGIQRKSERSGWKIDYLNSGKNPIGGDEPGLAELVERVVLEKKSFRVTDDVTVVKEMDYILIDVQTPTDEDNVPRYESLRAVSKQVGENMKKGATVIIESTCAPGTTNFLVQPILEEHSGMKAGEDFHLIFSYERVMVGRLLYNIVNLARIIGGLTPECTEKGMWLYKHIIKAELIPSNAITAELAKVVENTYRDVNIAFANEVALASESLGVDFHEVRMMVNSLPHDKDEKYNPHRNLHVAGAGVGGHCLPKDPWLMIWGVNKYGKKKVEFNVTEASRHLNMDMPKHTVSLFVESCEEAGIKPEEATVAVLGVAFLQDSDDTRNTPTKPLVEELKKIGVELKIHDPLVRKEEFEYEFSTDLEEVIKDTDAIILVTSHKEYYEIKGEELNKVMKTKIMIDGRNVFKGEELEKEGFIYKGVGKGKK
jgi:UDP-N-acetyl-D-mannosaminuronic acid dehydrogenase